MGCGSSEGTITTSFAPTSKGDDVVSSGLLVRGFGFGDPFCEEKEEGGEGETGGSGLGFGGGGRLTDDEEANGGGRCGGPDDDVITETPCFEDSD